MTTAGLMRTRDPNREADIIARRCLDAACGEPGYAVQLIYGCVTNDHKRRRTVNRLWKLMLAEHEMQTNGVQN